MSTNTDGVEFAATHRDAAPTLEADATTGPTYAELTFGLRDAVAQLVNLEAKVAADQRRTRDAAAARIAELADERDALQAQLRRERASVEVLLTQRDAAERQAEKYAADAERLEDQVRWATTDYATLRHAHAELEDQVGPLRQKIVELRSALTLVPDRFLPGNLQS